MRIIVVGGGIAGLTAAHALGALASTEVLLLEREEQLFLHSSGKNAAIFRPVELPRAVAELGVASARVLDSLFSGRSGWLRADGLLLTAPTRSPLEPLADVSREVGIDVTWLGRDELVSRAPVLAGGRAEHALWVPEGGVLDIHAIQLALTRSARTAGVELRPSRAVEQIVTQNGRVAGVVCQGETLHADAVVIAGGAWASELGASAGTPLPLAPVRRHLVMLEPDTPLAACAPTVWDAELGAYFRPESAGVLASPGDAEPWRAEAPAADPRALELLAEKLSSMAPGLASARVRRHWACLRTFAPDKVAVVGADPRLPGLHWFAGLGGHGLTAGVAMGDVLRAAIAEIDHPLLARLSPARFI